MSNRFARSWGAIFALFLTLTVLAALAPKALAQDAAQPAPFKMSRSATREDVLQHTLAPYQGPVAANESATTLTGKVMCGYQGWFNAPDDGAGRGWRHYGRGGKFAPGACNIDLWPDVSELSLEERFTTDFKLADGTPAQVFSSHNPKTVDRHFQWMKDYGIDGIFVQRFGVEVSNPSGLYHFNTVLASCRAAANRHGRAWAVMYDLSGLREGGTQVIIDDWKQLVDRMRVGRDGNEKAYLRHRGKPVVAVWGIGFNDGRRYTLEECARLVDFLKNDPQYGGNTVMVGIPTYWRTRSRDCLDDERVHEIAAAADIVSPWMVGRFGPDAVDRIAQDVWKGDLQWCNERKVDYLPVAFPGFSWHNMNPRSPTNQIPRQGGRFLWKQYTALHGLGATMIYQAMFDEVDEGTAIFKCTNSTPVGESKFVDYEGLPSDHYLWLVGQGGKLLRGEIESTEGLPDRK